MPMTPTRIRPLAICLFGDGDRILVAEGTDDVKGEIFYRPLGGTIEFGERAEQTLRRELREELDAEVTALRYLTTLENIFTYNGRPGHEIVLVFDGAFVDRAVYTRSQFAVRDDDGSVVKAVWKAIGEFEGGSPPLYPDGLLELIKRSR